MVMVETTTNQETMLVPQVGAAVEGVTNTMEDTEETEEMVLFT